MTKKRKIQTVNFVVFFIGWVIVFLLGADFPPPIGFIWLVVLILFLDIVQAYYLSKYFLKYIETIKKSKLFFSNLLFYFFGGLVVSLFTTVLRFESIGLTNSLIWIIVVTTVGIIYGIAFWAFNRLLYRLL